MNRKDDACAKRLVNNIDEHRQKIDRQCMPANNPKRQHFRPGASLFGRFETCIGRFIPAKP